MEKELQGKSRFLLFRILSKAEEEAGRRLAFQMDHEVSKTRDIDTEETKDGASKSLGSVETTISVTSNMAENDAFVDELEDAFDEGEIFEIWDSVVTKADVGNKHKSKYAQAYMSDFNVSAPADGKVELSMDFSVIGLPQRGEVTLTDAQEAAVQYEFRGTEVVVPGP